MPPKKKSIAKSLEKRRRRGGYVPISQVRETETLRRVSGMLNQQMRRHVMIAQQQSTNLARGTIRHGDIVTVIPESDKELLRQGIALNREKAAKYLKKSRKPEEELDTYWEDLFPGSIGPPPPPPPPPPPGPGGAGGGIGIAV